MKPLIKYLVTGAIVLVAIAVGVHRWRVYLENPWTRDGMVQANVIQIVPRVSGPVVTLPIRDNQFVHAGDLGAVKVVVTDTGIDARIARGLERRGITVIKA